MEKKYAELQKLFSENERDIARLKTELRQSELKKRKLKEEAKYHVAKLSPEYYKRFFEDDCKNVLDPNHRNIEEMFADQDYLCKHILGYNFKIGECSYEEVENNIVKKWEVEGAVGENTFIVNLSSEIDLEKVKTESKYTESVTIQSIEIFPNSKVFTDVATKLQELDFYLGLKVLIPCLYTYQRLQKDRYSVEEKLATYENVKVIEEDDVLLIDITVESFEFRIRWSISYVEKGCNFMSNFSIHAEEEEATRLFRDHECLTYLKGERQLLKGSDVLKFIESVFQT